ncbi:MULTISPECIES: CPBP family intramembrane glutamic endopeptidase [unclassified Clostridium]|uniref:CPBP family intramembrane glutamic endopeptidase n=1 Tax=unclassified Clostridium TaxID=2614128 RepID=UPI003216EC59
MKINKKIIYPITLIGIYMVYFFFLVKYFYNNDLLIGVKNITISNVGIQLLGDFLANLLIVIIIISIMLRKKQSLNITGTTRNGKIVACILFAIYIGIFFIKGDFSLAGIYKPLFFLITIGFVEEFIFRGYLFTELDKELPTYLAVIISGMMWGAMHATLPIILNNYSGIQSFSAIISTFGGYTAVGAIFVLLYKKSNSLIVPILVHALLDYWPVLVGKV